MTDIKYVAFDVHQATISAAVLNLEGKLLTQTVMQTDATAIRDFLRGLSGVVHLTFEEGTQAQWLYDLTHPLVTELIVCNPRLNHSKKRDNNSDRLDAFNLVKDLRAGLLERVYHGSPKTQTLKHLTHNYESVTEDTTRCMNRLKAVYRSQAVKCVGRDVYYMRNRAAWLEKLTEPDGRLRAEFLYKQLDHLRGLRCEVKKALLKEARREAAFKQLCAVPGLGPIRVAQLIAVIGSPDRFGTKRQLWTYCGFGVVTRSSADYKVVGDKLERRHKSAQTRGLNPNGLNSTKSWLPGAASDLKVTVGFVEFENGTRWIISPDSGQ
jgi:transposase